MTRKTSTKVKQPPHIKQTVMMEQVLDMILEELDQEISSDEMASRFHMNRKYFERAFQKYYELPFHQFVKKLKLNSAAEEVLRNQSMKERWQEFGYGSNIAFSRAFSQEFGMSPRDFAKNHTHVPDMPERQALWDTPIRCEYKTVAAKTVYGFALEPVTRNQKNLIEEAAHALLTEDARVDLEGERYGIWWFDSADELGAGDVLYYLFARDEAERRDCDTVRTDIPSDYYAVFSFERMDKDEDTALFMRLLTRYIFYEWKKISRKTPNRIGVTFESYDKERAYFYIPILEKYDKPHDDPEAVYGVDTWITYINEHIRDDLTIHQLAENARYSEKSYVSMFQLFYEMDPESYILRRRLHLAALEMEEGEDPHLAARHFHFDAYEDFCREFLAEYGCLPEQFDKSQVILPIDLQHYFNEFRNNIRISFVERDNFCIWGQEMRPVPDNGSRYQNQDITEVTCRLMKQKKAPSDMAQALKQLSRKAAIWDERINPETGEREYVYMMGPETQSAAALEGLVQRTSGDRKLILVKGGRYAVFSTSRRSDDKELVRNFRMMNRCVFYGWIHENMYRYDGERLTFVEYEKGKLYFYVPVK